MIPICIMRLRVNGLEICAGHFMIIWNWLFYSFKEGVIIMKKVFLLIILLILTLIFISCSNGGTDMDVFENDDEEIADMTLDEIITAVKLEDGLKLVDMFCNDIKSRDNLSQSVSLFFDFIHGDIVSVSTASESGVGTDYIIETGKMRKEIQSAFCIRTTESTYYIAIKECIVDEFDDNNIGIVSIYIIESINWHEDYVYRGDGKWNPGINIVYSP